jgi:hypothetical protein
MQMIFQPILPCWPNWNVFRFLPIISVTHRSIIDDWLCQAPNLNDHSRRRGGISWGWDLPGSILKGWPNGKS